jgi:putative hemolysin
MGTGAKTRESGMTPSTRARYDVCLASSAADLAEAQALRRRAFRIGLCRIGAQDHDSDPFDALCRHVLVRVRDSGTLVACFRVQGFAGPTIAQSYTAQFYDLSRLSGFGGPMLEIGRFCLHPDHHDPDILRLAWGSLARMVDGSGVTLLFGCSSFIGADVARHAGALRALRAHAAPDHWAPQPRAPERIALDQVTDAGAPGAVMPALLRSYLALGAWVSDHAVIDRDLDTLHVMTGVEISAIPPARARALRLIAGQLVGVL